MIKVNSSYMHKLTGKKLETSNDVASFLFFVKSRQ
jgi:hypothetical protein